MCDTTHRRGLSESLGPEPWKVRAWWKLTSPAFRITGSSVHWPPPRLAKWAAHCAMSFLSLALPSITPHLCEPTIMRMVPLLRSVSCSATQAEHILVVLHDCQKP